MPPVENLLGRDKSFFTKYVGMPTDEFLGEMRRHLSKIKGSPLLSQLSMKNDVQKNIPQLLLKGMVIFLINRLKEFIDLLQQHGAKSAMSLLLIPRTTLRAPETSHNSGQNFHFFHPLQIRDENRIRRVRA